MAFRVTPLHHRMLRLSITAPMVGALLYFVSLGDIIAELSGADPTYFLLGLLTQFLARAAATPRMHVIAKNQGFAVSHRQLFRILLISHYYSHLLPGPLAGGAATWVKYAQLGASKSAAGAAIILNRGYSLFVLLTVGLLGWLLTASPIEGSRLLLLCLLIAALLLSVTFARIPALRSRDAGTRIPGSRLVRGLRSLAMRLALFQQIPPRGKLIVLCSSIAFELTTGAALWCFSLAVGIDIGILTAIWMRAALEFILLAPIHLGGLGLREITLVSLGSVIGIAAAPAIAWSLLVFSGSLIIATAGGLLEAGAVSRVLGSRRST